MPINEIMKCDLIVLDIEISGASRRVASRRVAHVFVTGPLPTCVRESTKAGLTLEHGVS
jgi:hypothetical protein